MKLLIQLISLFSVASAFTVNNGFTRSTSSVLFMAEMQTGTVKWFNTQKGFGFITPDKDGPDVFVHQTEIKAEGFRSLADGEAVEYTTEEDTNGRLKATGLTGPGGANVQGAPKQNDYDDNYY